MIVDRDELALRLLHVARSNARDIGYTDSEIHGAYRRAEIFGDDEVLGAAYDRGFAAAEWAYASELAQDSFCAVSMRGVFVNLENRIVSDGYMSARFAAEETHV